MYTSTDITIMATAANEKNEKKSLKKSTTSGVCAATSGSSGQLAPICDYYIHLYRGSIRDDAMRPTRTLIHFEWLCVYRGT